jgi:hypothetical protein
MQKGFKNWLLLTLTALFLFGMSYPEGRAAHAESKPPVPLVWTDLNGRDYGPTQLRGAAATVFVFFSTQCPVSNAYMPRLRQMEQAYFARRIAFFLVNSNPLDGSEGIRRYAGERHLLMPLVKDTDGALAEHLGATLTPEAVVVGREGQTLYRGRIDDNKDATLARKHELTDALDAILAGHSVPTSFARPTGCYIVLPGPRKALLSAGVTYAHDVAAVLNRNCVSCHHDGDVAPFSLASYREASVWARQIKAVTQRRVMPPWKPLSGYGEFHNARSLTPQETSLLAKWADSGAPAGDLARAPKPPTFPAKWTLGQPDLILHARKPYLMAAEDEDVYREFVLPMEFKEDTYVTAAQIKPDKRAIVHHVILYIDYKGESLPLENKDGQEGFTSPNHGGGAPLPGVGWLAGWAPGGTPLSAPEGTAIKIPKGARLLMEVHYHADGRPERDQTEVGLTFAQGKVQKLYQVWPFAQGNLPLEANKANIQVAVHMETPSDTDLTLQAISPHMHRIGREMHVWATLPNGDRQELIWLDEWDFNWQETYVYREPIRLPAKTQIDLVATYDNSENNPRNPNRPPKRISWGEQTTDEMCIAFLSLTSDNEHLDITPAPWRETVVLLPSAQADAAAK